MESDKAHITSQTGEQSTSSVTKMLSPSELRNLKQDMKKSAKEIKQILKASTGREIMPYVAKSH